MELLTQTDKRWACDIIGKSGYSIGSSGCVLTSLCNCANLHGLDWTPDDLNRALYGRNGLTDTGLVCWNVAEMIFRCHIEPYYYLAENGKIKANGKVIFDGATQYIGRYNNSGVGHFTNIIGSIDNYYILFDVYSGKTLVKPVSYINRVVKVWW